LISPHERVTRMPPPLSLALSLSFSLSLSAYAILLFISIAGYLNLLSIIQYDIYYLYTGNLHNNITPQQNRKYYSQYARQKQIFYKS